MTYQKGHHPGAIWLKTDLQCHSPRDRGWRGTLNGLKGGTQHFDDARKAWARSFVAACGDRNLKVAAITDHHDYHMAECVASEAKSTGDIYFFRGIEVTCEDNVQCLAIFDPNCGENILAKFLGMLTGVMGSNINDEYAPETAPCHMSLLELFEAVENEPLVRDQCILLPHFSRLEAHKSANSHGHHIRFADLACDGVYIEVPHSELDHSTIDKIQGRISEWGNRRRAIVATGDNKSETWERLGAHDCWMKLGEHSLEALRQALLADEARISFNEPELPDERISHLKVRSTLTGSDDLSIMFNAGFNALIGGRGSGKSSVIEYLRFGLARTSSDLRLPDGAVPRERNEKLIEDTLHGDGYVEIAIERDGVSEIWRRTYQERDHIEVIEHDGAKLQLTLDDARRRFRARAFEQKGLSSTMNERAQAADQITGIAAAEELEQRRQIDEDILKSKRAVTTAMNQAAAYWQLHREEIRSTFVVTDLKKRLAANSERLQADGVNAEAMQILELAPEYARGNSFIRSVENSVKDARRKINDASLNILDSALSEFPAVFPEFDKIQEAAEKTRTKINELMLQARGELSKFEDVCAHVGSNHDFDALVFYGKHKEAIAEQSKHRLAIEDNQRLTKDYELAIEKERVARASALAHIGCVEKLVEARRNLQADLLKRRSILQAAAEKVEGHSGRALIAKVKRDPKPEEFRSALDAICAGSYLQDASEKCHQRAEALATDGWEALCDLIIDIYRDKILMGSSSEPTDAQAERLAQGIFGTGANIPPRTMKRFFTALEDRTVGEFLSSVPRDLIVLTYVDDQGRKIGFDRASPGQQASALLELLLRQSAGTLIIDQPEDDLDNKVVMKIVDLIRTSKNRRQLIFATHNPNVVVNGDADKVVSLTTGEPDPRPDNNNICIAIDEDGAIETPAIKASITHIMEGGKTAFELRRRKYRFSS